MKGLKLFLTAGVFTVLGLTGVNAAEMTVCSSGCDYDSMKNAIEHATDGDTIKMTEDMTNSDTLLVRNKITFDLGGKKLTTSAHFVVLPGEGTNPDVTIKNGTIELTDKDIQLVVQSAATKNTANTKLTIEKDATILNNSEGKGVAAIMVQSRANDAYDATVDIKGTLKGTTFAITTHGDMNKVDAQAPVINIYDTAKLTAVSGPAIYAAGYATWNIKGGEFTGTEGLSAKSGIINISGGEFYAKGEYVENPVASGNGPENTGAALSFTSNNTYAGNMKINVTGGMFKSEKGNALYVGNTAADTTAVKEIKINEGAFYAADGKDSVKVATNEEVYKGMVNGGTYNKAPETTLLNEGLTTKTDANGNITVVEVNNGNQNNTENTTNPQTGDGIAYTALGLLLSALAMAGITYKLKNN